MSEIQAELEHMPKRRVMWPVHTLATGAFHPETHFENGAVEDLHEHRDIGGSTLLLMTHFRRTDPLIMAQLALKEEPLHHLICKTGITVRRGVFESPYFGLIVRNSGAHIVDRSLENLSETPEQGAARKDANQRTQMEGARYLEKGLNWLIYPEGNSREIVMKAGKPVIKDGKPVKKPRKPGVLLPVYKGFANTLAVLSDQARERTKLLGIVVHYGERRFSGLRPTVHISRPVSPIKGSVEDIRQQGQTLLQHGLDEAIRLDALRK